jgi:hypothetical protein
LIVWPAGSTQQCELVLKNTSDYLAETVLVNVLFPQKFVVTKATGGARLVAQTEELSAFGGYTGVFWERDKSHAHLTNSIDPVGVRVPTEKGEYVLPVRIHSARARMTKSELKVIIN